MLCSTKGFPSTPMVTTNLQYVWLFQKTDYLTGKVMTNQSSFNQSLEPILTVALWAHHNPFLCKITKSDYITVEGKPDKTYLI